MAENNYDLEYTGSMVDRILDTGYDLQNQGYIFRGLASHYTGTPTERTWLIAPTGSTGFGLSSPVPPGSIGICMYNGSSWSAEVLNTLTLDSAPTTGSGNGITSGAVKTLAESITNAIGQLEQSVSDRFTSLELEDTTGSLQTELLSITLKYVFEGETEPLTSISILAATAEKAGLMSSADKQKLDSLIDNIRSIRLVDVTASADKGSQMDLSLKWTVNNTEEMLTYLTLLAATTNTAGLMSAADKAKLDRLNIVGCQYAGIATPSTTPLVVDAKMFYIAVQSGNYSNFGLTVPEGISILKNEGYGWAIENLVRIDDQPTDGSAGIARSGGTFSMISTESATRESADATLSAAVVAEQNARKAAIQEEKNAREHADDMMIHEIETFEQGVRDTVAEYKPIVIQGDVQNAPDEVDLTSTPDNLLKFKDNIYNPVLWSGMGRIYLRKNIIPESENYPFDGFVNDVPTGGELDGEPDAVLWDRINTVFVGEKDGVYYNTWTACDKYVPARTNVIYMYDGTPYLWDGDDFAVDEDVVPNLKNILTEDMMPYGNTIYVIRWDYYLNGDVTVPDSCILEFDGGSINGNYTITGQNTGINAELVKIFSSDVILDGTWNVAEAYPEWFGAVGDGVTDDRESIQKIIDTFNYIVFQNKTYKISSYSTVDNNKYGLTISRDNVIIEGKALGDWNSKATKFIVDEGLDLYAVLGIFKTNISIKGITICGTSESYINCDYGIACPIVKSSLTFEKVFVRFITGTSFWLNAYNVDMRGCVSSEANCGFHIFGGTAGRNTSAVLYKCVSNSCPGNAFKMVEMSYSSFINCTADRVGFDADNMSDENISHVFYLESCNCIQLLNCATEISYKVLKTVSINREILVNNCIFFTSTDNIPEDFDYSTIYDISGDVKVENSTLCRLAEKHNIFKVDSTWPLSSLLIKNAVYINNGRYERYNVICDDNHVVIENTISSAELSSDNAYINNIVAITNARSENVNITIPRNMEFDSNIIIKNFKGLCNIFGDSTHQIIFRGNSVFTDIDEIILTSQHQSVTFFAIWEKKCLTLNNSKIIFVGVNFGDFPSVGSSGAFLYCTNNSTVVLKDCTLTYNSGALTDIIKCSGNSKVEIYYSDKLVIIDDNGAKQIVLSPLS